MTGAEEEELVRLAAVAARKAYAPYSKFPVGAALRSTDGRVFTACNVENASFGLTICAERAAVFKAVSEGARTFDCLALSVPGAGAPCGACRQVLREFAPDLPILLGDENGQMARMLTLGQLLPDSFGPESLDPC
jgi:cytidine deaminase